MDGVFALGNEAFTLLFLSHQPFLSPPNVAYAMFVDASFCLCFLLYKVISVLAFTYSPSPYYRYFVFPLALSD